MFTLKRLPWLVYAFRLLFTSSLFCPHSPSTFANTLAFIPPLVAIGFIPGYGPILVQRRLNHLLTRYSPRHPALLGSGCGGPSFCVYNLSHYNLSRIGGFTPSTNARGVRHSTRSACAALPNPTSRQQSHLLLSCENYSQTSIAIIPFSTVA